MRGPRSPPSSISIAAANIEVWYWKDAQFLQKRGITGRNYSNISKAAAEAWVKLFKKINHQLVQHSLLFCVEITIVFFCNEGGTYKYL